MSCENFDPSLSGPDGLLATPNNYAINDTMTQLNGNLSANFRRLGNRILHTLSISRSHYCILCRVPTFIRKRLFIVSRFARKCLNLNFIYFLIVKLFFIDALIERVIMVRYFSERENLFMRIIRINREELKERLGRKIVIFTRYYLKDINIDLH